MVIPLSPLDRKVLRDLWRMRSQAFAIALVIAAGVGMVVMSLGMMRSLDATRDAYYDRYRFADIFAPAKRAPKSLLAEIGNIKGVSQVEGRITSGATLDVAGISEPITTRIHSIPASGEPRIDALVLRSGRWPDPKRPDEVLASEKFATAARISLGDSVDALLYGKRQRLRIVGTALSPEYIYAIGPGQIFPDNRRFGVLWMGEEHLAAALDLTDSFNEALIRLDRAAVPEDVIAKLDNMLARYGGISAYPRSEQISDRFVSNELAQLRTMTGILPPIFLGVAAALGLYITSAGSSDNVARMIDILFDQANRADVMVTFAEPRDERALFALARAPGVWRVEPMRAVGAKLSGTRKSKSDGLTGATPGSDLNRLVGIDGAIIEPPARGVLVSYGLSKDLGLAAGDLVHVQITEGRRERFELPVAGIIKSAVGNPAYVDMDMIARRMKEAPLASGAYLGVDAARIDDLYRYLKATPIIAGVSLRAASRSGLEETIGETMGIVTLFNTGFSALIVFGVIYNNARISLAERARDLASLRVLGYRRSEVSYILLGELAILTLTGLPFGIAFGYFLSRSLSASFGGDLFIIPFGLSTSTVAWAVLIVLLAAAITALFVRRRLDRLELVAVLKTWD